MDRPMSRRQSTRLDRPNDLRSRRSGCRPSRTRLAPA